MFLLACVISCISLADGSPCSSQSCAGPYKLEGARPPVMKTTSSITHAQVVFYPPTVKGLIGYRSRYTAYCYNGGNVDPHTGCFKNHKNYRPTCEELRQWEKDKKCSYGWECLKNGDCWGSDASKCLDTNTNINKAARKEFQDNNEEYMYFPHHACVSSWRCGFTVTHFPLHVMRSNREKVGTDHFGQMLGAATYDAHGNEIPIDTGKATPDDETMMCFDFLGVTKGEFETEVSCFGTGTEAYTCQLNDKFGDYSGSYVTFNSDYVAYIGNYMISLTGKVKELTLNGTSVGNRHWMKTKAATAASVEDLSLVSQAQLYLHQEMEYNLLKVAQSIAELEQKVIKIVNSVSKLDDELMGEILGVFSRTKWFNRELFHMCPCFQVGDDGMSNCASGYAFVDGRLKIQDESVQCTSYSPDSIIRMYPFTNLTYTFSKLHIPPEKGVSQDWEGWSWLSERKMDLLKAMAFQSSVSSGNAGVLSILYETAAQTFSIWSWFTKFSSFAAWLGLLLAVISICRK
ncbi:hemagglutinin protein [Araguari virus]|uniref:Hemagglutinin protein n=1 Tax=Araguari virus TaxID=352236 RepID=A0A343FNE3_9ORTO|nr:hemagglutinin protein [Araguari virus]ASR92126.1 hemagglutinin protein [Araguari virus]